MKLIKQSFAIHPQENGLEGIYKQIELAGRTCYKSEDKITEDSAKGFVDRMIKSKHYAMLEHGTVYLAIPITHETSYRINSYKINPYTKIKLSVTNNTYYITTNLRVLVENGWMDDLQYLCEPTEYHEKRITVKFVTDQGILREFTRHKLFCVA
jgi:thymidylate synthase (FAD)